MRMLSRSVVVGAFGQSDLNWTNLHSRCHWQQGYVNNLLHKEMFPALLSQNTATV